MQDGSKLWSGCWCHKTLEAPWVTCIHFMFPFALLEKTFKDMLSYGSRAVAFHKPDIWRRGCRIIVSRLLTIPVSTNINHGVALPFFLLAFSPSWPVSLMECLPLKMFPFVKQTGPCLEQSFDLFWYVTESLQRALLRSRDPFVTQRRVKPGRCEESALAPRLQAAQLTILGVHEGRVSSQRGRSFLWPEVQVLYLAPDSGEKQLKSGNGLLECTRVENLCSSLQCLSLHHLSLV